MLAGDDGAAEPPRWLVLAGAAGLGLAMGVVLGAAQAWAMLGPQRRTWVVANAAGWPPAMCVIFLGATAPSADWPWEAVLLAGLGTGVSAGAVLGVVTGAFLPRLAGAGVRDGESPVRRLR